MSLKDIQASDLETNKRKRSKGGGGVSNSSWIHVRESKRDALPRRGSFCPFGKKTLREDLGGKRQSRSSL